MKKYLEPNKVYCWLNISGFKKLVVMPRFTPIIQVMILDGAEIHPYDPNDTTTLLDHEIWTFRLARIASEHMAYYEFESKRNPEIII